MLEISSARETPKILVIGVGGAGNNAIERLISADIPKHNTTYISVNTDAQVLEACSSDIKLQIGNLLTHGYGAGADPAIGAQSVDESIDDITEAVTGADMVILTCGMGGGTGSGATPKIASICKKLRILTLAVITKPFTFEGKDKTRIAEESISALRPNVDTLFVISNDKLLELSDKKLFLEDAFMTADMVLKHSISGITNIIYNRGTINLDFNDLCTVLRDHGSGHLGIGVAEENETIIDAVDKAINSPILDTKISGAGNVLLNCSGKINLPELNEAGKHITQLTGPDCKIIWGTVNTPDSDKIIVTLIATGLGTKPQTPLRIAESKPAFLRSSPVKAIRSPENAKNYPHASGMTHLQLSHTFSTEVKPLPQFTDVPKLITEHDIKIPEFIKGHFKK